VQTFISFEEARRIELATVAEQPVEHVSLDEAQGRTLAVAIDSRDTIPPFDNSAMDGYAVRAADVQDVPVTLPVAGQVPAGTSPERAVAPGSCVQIMTGAPVPEGADAVVPVEWTEQAGDGRIRVRRAPEAGQYVRPAGQDVRAGERVIDAGQVVTPPVVGMLATLGYAEVAVRVPPRIAAIATGDELVEVDRALGPGQIRNSNGHALAAQVRSAGAGALPPLLARDDKADIRRIIEKALSADVLLFSGGVSVGEYDLVKQVLDAMGMELYFWKVRQRPGKPLAFGVLQGKPVFGLPGNPVSSAMCFEQHVRPALATMLGRQRVLRPRHPAILDVPSPKVENLHHFARGVAAFADDGRLHVRDTGPQASNLYSSVVRANCIIHLPDGLAEAEPGLEVEIEWLDWAGIG
jgi:molybdopterin molybdotransferase